MTKHSRSGSFLLLTGNEATQDALLSIESIKVRLLVPKGIFAQRLSIMNVMNKKTQIAELINLRSRREFIFLKKPIKLRKRFWMVNIPVEDEILAAKEVHVVRSRPISRKNQRYSPQMWNCTAVYIIIHYGSIANASAHFLCLKQFELHSPLQVQTI